MVEACRKLGATLPQKGMVRSMVAKGTRMYLLSTISGPLNTLVCILCHTGKNWKATEMVRVGNAKDKG